MMSKYERIGHMVEQIAIKERTIESWNGRTGKKAEVVIELLNEEINDLKLKIAALV